MAKSNTPEPEILDEQQEVETEADATPPMAGFHVQVNGNSIGCYPTAEDAQHFINGHLVPQGIEATIVEVAA